MVQISECPAEVDLTWSIATSFIGGALLGQFLREALRWLGRKLKGG